MKAATRKTRPRSDLFPAFSKKGGSGEATIRRTERQSEGFEEKSFSTEINREVNSNDFDQKGQTESQQSDLWGKHETLFKGVTPMIDNEKVFQQQQMKYYQQQQQLARNQQQQHQQQQRQEVEQSEGADDRQKQGGGDGAQNEDTTDAHTMELLRKEAITRKKSMTSKRIVFMILTIVAIIVIIIIVIASIVMLRVKFRASANVGASVINDPSLDTTSKETELNAKLQEANVNNMKMRQQLDSMSKQFEAVLSQHQAEKADLDSARESIRISMKSLEKKKGDLDEKKRELELKEEELVAHHHNHPKKKDHIVIDESSIDEEDLGGSPVNKFKHRHSPSTLKQQHSKQTTATNDENVKSKELSDDEPSLTVEAKRLLKMRQYAASKSSHKSSNTSSNRVKEIIDAVVTDGEKDDQKPHPSVKKNIIVSKNAAKTAAVKQQEDIKTPEVVGNVPENDTQKEDNVGNVSSGEETAIESTETTPSSEEVVSEEDENGKIEKEVQNMFITTELLNRLNPKGAIIDMNSPPKSALSYCRTHRYPQKGLNTF